MKKNDEYSLMNKIEPLIKDNLPETKDIVTCSMVRYRFCFLSFDGMLKYSYIFIFYLCFYIY